MTSVTLLQRDDSASWPPRPGQGRRWAVVTAAGTPPCHAPAEADTEMPVGETYVLALRGRVLPAADRRILAAFAAQAEVVIEQQRLTAAADAAKPLAEADRIKAALLAAVKPRVADAAGVGEGGRGQPAQQRNDLDAGRAGGPARHRRRKPRLAHPAHGEPARPEPAASRRMSAALHPVALNRVVARALDALGPTGEAVTLQVPADLPAVQADEMLLERVVANLAANAARHSPPDQPADADRQRTRRSGGASRHRPWPRHPRRRPGADVRTVRKVPCGQLRWSGARTGAVPRLRRGDGRHPRPGGHPGRRAHDGAVSVRGGASSGGRHAVVAPTGGH